MVDRINDSMTEDELVAILREAAAQEPENEPNTITTPEYVAAADVSEYRARLTLARLADDGVLVRDRVQRVNAWGERQTVKGFRYVGGG